MRVPALLALVTAIALCGGCATAHVQHRTLTGNGERTDLIGVAIAANPPLALVLAVQVLATGNETGEIIGAGCLRAFA